MKAVLLAGGKGRRLYPYTTVLPKPLMPLGDMPILEIIINQLKTAGITEIIMSVGHLANLIMAYFGDGEQWGIPITYSIEHEALGTAGPLKLVEGLNDDILFMNGDVLTTINYNKFIEFHKKEKAIFTVASFERDSKIDFGVLKIDNGNIIDYIEKPVYEFKVSMGIYCINASGLDYIEKNKYLDVPDLILMMIKDKKIVKSYTEDCMWLDIGRVDDYENATKIFEENKSKFLDVSIYAKKKFKKT